MGNTHTTDSTSNLQSNLIGFHHIHGNNIQVSTDGRKAKRLETFCNGICFGDRPVAIAERVFVRVAEVSTSWSGVLRFGFTSNDPLSIDPTTLPRYACPDLTNKPGYWAKALPERHAQHGNVLQFYVSRAGDVYFSVNGEDKGIFFTNVSVDCKLWPLVDIYGNTTGVEFIDPQRLLATRAVHPQTIDNPPPQETFSQNTPINPHTASLPDVTSQMPPPVPVRHHTGLLPLTFHKTTGKNMSLSADLTVASRKLDEYCNGFVFTARPLRLGERVVVQVLNTDSTFNGSMAFGMTSCDISKLSANDLPDDSDLLLDRPEYWVVNKDVCSKPNIADELAFHLTEQGEIRYSRNGFHVSTLMHVDRTITLWAFFDVYGNMQKIKILGVSSGADNMLPHSKSSRVSNGHNTVSSGRSVSTNRSHSLVSPLPRPPLSISPTPYPSLPPKPARLMSLSSGQQPSGGSSSSAQAGQRKLVPLPTPVPDVISPPLLTIDSAGVPINTTPIAGITKEAQDNANNECSVCLEKPTDCVIYTCGHMCMCYECACDVKENQGASCPICRQTIKDIIKIYRS